jgi:hypothetical protein
MNLDDIPRFSTVQEAETWVCKEPKNAQMILSEFYVEQDLDGDEANVLAALEKCSWTASKCPKIMWYLSFALVEYQLRRYHNTTSTEYAGSWSQTMKAQTIREAISEAQAILAQ